MSHCQPSLGRGPLQGCHICYKSFIVVPLQANVGVINIPAGVGSPASAGAEWLTCLQAEITIAAFQQKCRRAGWQLQGSALSQFSAMQVVTHLALDVLISAG